MHKLKRLVQYPDSIFMDVKCKKCGEITTIFSHSHTAVCCGKCGDILCSTQGGKAKLVLGTAWRRKGY